MASNYPTSLDSFTNPTANDSLNSPSHALQHANANDAIEAIEAKLGIGASTAGSATSGYVLTAGTGGTTTWSAPSIAGLTQIVPTSITKGASGSASVSSGGAVTFSGTESISLNGCFSANYDNYKLLVNFSTQSAATAILFRFRISSSDNSTNNYLTSTLGTSSWTSATTVSQVSTATSFDISYAGSNENTASEYSIFNPFLSQKSYIVGTPVSNTEGRWRQIKFNDTTSFDGFSLIASSGTITGTIRVYGYKNG